jgi:hypothetical protein
MNTLAKDIYSRTLGEILSEVKKLRGEVSLLISAERVEEYQNEIEIKQSYLRAVKAHPPIWK